VRADLHFAAMGTRARVLVVDGPDDLPAHLEARVHELERLWSRFVPTSEVSRLNRAGGTAVTVSPETMELLTCAIAGWEASYGLFDPTILEDLEQAGYDRTFDEITDKITASVGPNDAPGARRARLGRTTSGIKLDFEAGQARLTDGLGFDPGGIGKGLAADLIAAEALAAGAAGVLVDLGGDVRVSGRPPASAPHWSVEIEDPLAIRPIDSPPIPGLAIGIVELVDGAVATSSRMRRQWTVGDESRHHLIDPRLGRPVISDVAAVTVVAACGWQAEVLAKAAFVGGPVQGLGLVAQLGGTALLIDEHGHQIPGEGWARYAPTTDRPTTDRPTHLQGAPS
jgi:thiamine biosynthesis lipoprotein